MKKKDKNFATVVDSVISSVLVELDNNQNIHQSSQYLYYGKQDEEAKRIHLLLVGLCKKIRDRIFKEIDGKNY